MNTIGKTGIFLALAAFALQSPTAGAVTLHVSASGDGTDGASWETAHTTLAAAVSAANAGDTIVLDDDTFTLSGNLSIDKGVTITSRTDKDSSIIECHGNYIELKTSASTLDGVTFVNTSSGMFYCPALAVQVSVAGCLVTNCVFRQCGNNMTGGNSRFVVNASQGVTISGCIVTNNYGYFGPGLNLTGPNTKVENCLIADNRARNYSGNYPYIGLCCGAGNGTVVRNCTIANNSLESDSGSVSALVVQSGTGSSYENNIIWNNTNGKSSKSVNNWTYNQRNPMGSVVTTTDMSNWKNNCTTGTDGVNALGGSGNISGDPLFRAGGFSVSGASPCIGAANANAPDLDVFGTARPSPATIGAVEYVAGDSIEIGLTASAASAFTPGSVTLTVLAAGTYAEPLEYAFDLDGDGNADVTQSSPTYVISEVGAYTPSVTVTDANSVSASAAVSHEIIIYDPAKVVYVKADAASPKKPFMSEATATSSIADAVAACPDGGTVLVESSPAPYQLTSTVTFIKAIQVVGTGDSPSDVVIDVNKRCNPAFSIEGAGASLRNLTVYRAGTDYGEPLAVRMSASSLVSNCVFTGTALASGFANRNMLNATAGIVSGCVFTNNTVGGCPGFNVSNGVVVENCLVANNTITSSTYSYLGAVHCSGAATVRNCTIAGNVCTDGGNAAVSAALAGTPGLVENCVFAGNTRKVGGEQMARNDPGTTSAPLAASVMQYCAIDDAAADYSGYTGMVTEDIAFQTGGYIPARTSALVNAGSPGATPLSALDLLGGRRIVQGRIDIGCYELATFPFFIYLK